MAQVAVAPTANLQLLLDEAAEFNAQARRFLDGDIDEDTFRTFRLRRGIYGQRQPGVQMVRIKIPSGIVNADQLRAMAEVAGEFGHGIGHITTRQDVQIHFVPLVRVVEALERLAYSGLTTREACGNSVRNVTACAMAGHCPGQAFDVRPFSLAITQRFIRNPLTAALPRKFKISFSCSVTDCALGDIHDIGAAAVVRDGRRGFRLRVGGGLGPLPLIAQTLYEFVPVEELGPVCDGILKVFDEHGNRQDKHRARMKFVLKQHGLEWFRQAVEEARRTYDSPPWDLPEPIALSPGEPVWITVPQGNLSAAEMQRLAGLAEKYGDGTVALMYTQDLLINGVLPRHRAALEAELRASGFRLQGQDGLPDVITCPGAATCNLGITRSMDLGAAVTKTLTAGDDPFLRQIKVRVSGCPNSCGHHHIGQIGFYGNSRKIDGESAPFYQLLIGGGKHGDTTRFGKAVLSIPARLAPEAVDRITKLYLDERTGGEDFVTFVDRAGVPRFRQLLADLPGATGEDMLMDWGEEHRFTVKLGRGECAT